MEKPSLLDSNDKNAGNWNALIAGISASNFSQYLDKNGPVLDGT